MPSRYSYAMVCASNLNRSMAAHELLKSEGFNVRARARGGRKRGRRRMAACVCGRRGAAHGLMCICLGGRAAGAVRCLADDCPCVVCPSSSPCTPLV